MIAAWSRMNYSQRLVYNKLISGSFRVGVSQQLVVRALSQISELPPDIIAHRAMGDWEPTPEFIKQLLDPETLEENVVRGAAMTRETVWALITEPILPPPKGS